MTSTGQTMTNPPISLRLNGKFALITGASRGIGRAIAERFATEGAIVAIDHYRDTEAAEATLAAIQSADDARGFGLRPHFHVDADVGSEASIEAMMAITLERFGRLDILVNNAGIQAETPGDSFDAATLTRILQVNLIGSAIVSRAAIAHFLTRARAAVRSSTRRARTRSSRSLTMSPIRWPKLA